MNNILLIPILLFCFIAKLIGQSNYDKTWRLGQGPQFEMVFEQDGLMLRSILGSNSIGFRGTVSCISDESGKLQFYSNGCDIYSASNMLMENGDMISPGFVEDIFCNSVNSNPIPQGGFILPIPNKNNQYYALNYDLQLVEYFDKRETLDPQRLLLHKVDMNLNNGEGAVISKNEVVIEDDLALVRGQLQAVKHGNGIDWWVMAPKSASNCYQLVLLGSDGVIEEKTTCSGELWNTIGGTGQAVFSQDGSRYVRANPWNGIHIFDFDRCSGELFNPIVFPFSETGFTAAGVSISPDGNLLYVTRLNKIFQFDLQAEDIENSKILIDTLGTNLPSFSAAMYLCQLGPDDKIYISGTGTHTFFHVINAPNERGLACDFIQNGIELPERNFGGIPNFPNYDLGPSTTYCEPLSTNVLDKSILTRTLDIFPNPTNQKIVLFAEEEIISSYAIYSILGTELIKSDASGSRLEVDVSVLSPGAYIISAQLTNGNFSIGKLIKE